LLAAKSASKTGAAEGFDAGVISWRRSRCQTLADSHAISLMESGRVSTRILEHRIFRGALARVARALLSDVGYHVCSMTYFEAVL
jgi:hypothetical protein